MTPEIPETSEQITSGWLSGVLGRDVGGLTLIRIGEDAGFTGGGLYRLRFDGGSLVAKLSPGDAATRALFARANRREVTFYTTLGQGLPVPGCVFGAFDADTGASVLVLEDLEGHRPGDFLTGLSGNEAGAVVDALADIQAAWWDAPELAALSGADCLDEFRFAECWAQYPQTVGQLLPDIVLPPEFLSLGDHIAANADAIFGGLMETGPVTVLHRDCQADNVMFGRDGGAVIYDWQFMGKGRGVYDVAFLLTSSLEPDVRRRGEADIVKRYHRRLCAAGVDGYGWQQCWLEYRQAWVARFFLTVVATVLIDNDSPHRRAWRRTDLTRLLAFMRDHGVGPQLYEV